MLYRREACAVLDGEGHDYCRVPTHAVEVFGADFCRGLIALAGDEDFANSRVIVVTHTDVVTLALERDGEGDGRTT